MSKSRSEVAWPAPWQEDTHAFVAGVRALLPLDRLAVGVIRADGPRPDELLVVHAWDTGSVAKWCESGFSSDKLLRAAMRSGTAAGAANSESGRGAPQHALVAVLPESPGMKTWWWVMLARRDQAYSTHEQDLAALMLRHWQALFSLPDEAGMGRLLLGSDDRIIAADLQTQARLLGDPDLLQELIKVFHPILEQRFPDLSDQTTRDFAIERKGQPLWVCFRRARATPGDGSEHWYIETRPLGDDELTTVGVVPDPRIALAIAYIHENFAHSPSLNDIARHVHVSPFHFHRLFSKQVGASPKHYLQGKQLQVARWMLRRSSVAISVVAKQTGFSSHGHFTSTFHRLVGKSPSEYREAAH